VFTMNKKQIIYDHFYGAQWYRGVTSGVKELRSNVILLGDIMEDASMVDHDKHDTVVKVGFLNKHDDQKFDDFKTVYDIIVQEDGSMHAVNAILRATCSGHKNELDFD
jgi:hypothetical protein